MARLAFPSMSSIMDSQSESSHTSSINSDLPKRAPRKSILKTYRRPSLGTTTNLVPLTQSITDRFPLELVRIVLDFVQQHDRRTLAACSTVCRAWLPLCRAHFHPRMTVHPGNAAHFLDVLASPQLTMRANVHHLIVQKEQSVVEQFFLPLHSPISCAKSPSTNAASPRSPPPPASPSFHLSHILDTAAFALPCITKITLQKGYGENAELAHSLGAFHHLAELEMRSLRFTTFADLTAVISAQPGLRRLALTDIAWGHTPPNALVNQTPLDHKLHSNNLPNLRRLELYMEHQAQLFNWFLQQKPGGALAIEHVELGGITEVDDAIALSRFLRTLGPALKHLRLYSPSRISQVNLVHNTGLESLKISHLHIGLGDRLRTNADIPMWTDRTSASDEVCTILAQLCSPHIAALSLQLLFSEPECFAFIDWNQVARTLALPRYQNLQLLELRIPRLKRWMAATIVRSLPSIANRGILFVVNG